jgi:hypothetical protein
MLPEMPSSPIGRDSFMREKLGDLLYAGGKPTLDALKAGEPAKRADLEAAFAAAGDATATIAIVLTEDTRRAITELMPLLPKEVGGADMTILAKGVQFVAVGIDLPPKSPSVRVIIQGADAATAEAAHKALVSTMTAIGQMDAVKEILPSFDQVVAAIEPSVEGDRLVIELSEANGRLPKLLHTLEAPLKSARAQAGRAQSVNNLKQIGLALHNYHDVYKSFPPAAIYSKDGKPLLSWRVAMLPYLHTSQGNLLKKFRLDEPWDSEHNRALIARMP